MTRRISILVAILLFPLGAVAQGPVASFTVDVSTGVPPFTVTFTDTSSGVITGRTWTFDDCAGDQPTNTTETTMIHTYLCNGSDQPSLTVSGVTGSSKTNGHVQCFLVNFTRTPSIGPAPLLVSFSSTYGSEAFTNFYWDFGDGFTTNSVNQTTAHTYASMASNTVILTASGIYGSGIKTQVNSVIVKAFGVTPTTDCAFSGNRGGPFSPTNTYTISNAGTPSLGWTASKTASWLTLSATNGSLSGGGSTNINVWLNSTANDLTNGLWSDTLFFSNTTDGVGNVTRGAALTVLRNWPLTFYAATNGMAEGQGTLASPWDIYTAFTATGAIQGGDTVCLLPGTYIGGWLTNYLDELHLGLIGTSNAPVTVRPYGTDKVRISCNVSNSHDILHITGTYTILRDVEIFDPSTDRWGANNNCCYADSLTVQGPFNKVVNSVIHDTGEGVYIMLSATNTEVYGCTIFNNGCQNLGVDARGHGHGFYVKSAIPKTLLSDNIIFDQEGNGIQCYTEGNDIPLNGIDLEGNVVFGNGRMQADGVAAYGIQAGGYGLMGVDNFTACSNISLGGNDTFDAGYRAGGIYGCVGGNTCSTNYVNGTATITHNHLLGNNVGAYYWSNLTFAANFVGGATGSNDTLFANVFGPWLIFPQPNVDSFTLADCIYGVDSNSYFMRHTIFPDTFMIGTSHVWTAFGDYTNATGFDVHSTISSAPPTNIEIDVRVNKYDPNRAQVTVINWPTNNTVAVDLSKLLTNGDTYTILNGQDPLSNAVASGTYTGPVALAMNNLTVAIPTGTNQAPSSVGPFFGVFIAQKTTIAQDWISSVTNHGWWAVQFP